MSAIVAVGWILNEDPESSLSLGGMDVTLVVLSSDSIHSKDSSINAHILAVAESGESGITVSVLDEMIKGNNVLYIHAMLLSLH